MHTYQYRISLSIVLTTIMHFEINPITIILIKLVFFKLLRFIKL